jgi:hypothetical protein
MANLAGFNAAEVEPNAGFEIIPPGDYEACIVSSDMKSTKDGTGKYLNLEIQILGGQYQNRKLFEKLNLENKNPTAVTIAKGTLSAICRAVGVLTPNDSSDLHNKAFRISVGTRKREDNGELENRIKSFKPRNASAPVAAMVAAVGGEVVGTQTAKPW